MRKWRIEDSEDLYNVRGWGGHYFSINENGHIIVTPKEGCASVDLPQLVDELALRDVSAPILVRFPDIIDDRINKIDSCFKEAAAEYEFKGQNFVVLPIKVNQMRPVVEEIVSHGKKFNIGLEAGSKPELHAIISINTDPDAPINKIADYVIVGSVEEVVPKLIKYYKQNNKKNSKKTTNKKK